MSLSEHIRDRVEFDTNGGCWLWSAGVDKNGYGKFIYRGYQFRASRASWIAHTGDIPEGLHVLHSCDTPACVNPSHLRLGTHQENMDDVRKRKRRGLDFRAWARRTHCAHGHEITPENTYVKPDGKHQCRPCRRAMRNAWKRAYRARQKSVGQAVSS